MEAWERAKNADTFQTPKSLKGGPLKNEENKETGELQIDPSVVEGAVPKTEGGAITGMDHDLFAFVMPTQVQVQRNLNRPWMACAMTINNLCFPVFRHVKLLKPINNLVTPC